MRVRLKQIGIPPVMADEVQNRTARIVRTVIVALMLIGVVVIVADLAIGYIVGIPALVIGLGLALAAWGLLQRGRVTAAAVMVLSTTLIVATVQLYIGQGIHDPTVIVYPVLVILAGLVFDRRRFIAFTVATLLSLGGIVCFELHGLVHEAFPGATSWYDFAVSAPILILAAVGTRLLADDQMRSLSQARRELAERTRIEAALRDSEARYRSFVEQSTDGLILIDEDGLISEWNEAQELITGLKRAQVVGRPQWVVQSELVPPELRGPKLEARWQNMVLDALKTGHSPLFNRFIDSVMVTPSGERRHIQLSIFPIQTEHGWRLGAITLDVTSRKQMEETLRRSESGLAEAQRISHLGSWTWDLTSDKFQCSDEMFRLAGLPPQATEITQEMFLKVLHPDDVAWILQQIQSGQAENLSAGFEHRLVRPTGEIQYVYSRAKIYYDEYGQPLRVLGSTQDITERKQAEAALRASEDRFRALVQNSSDVITVHQADGTITYESPSAGRVLGYGAGGLIGQHPIALIHPDDAQLLQVNWQEVVERRNDELPTELRFRRADGEWLYLEVIGKNLLEHPGIRGIVVTARNVTERKRAEAEREKLFAELENRNTELERFTYTVSHDLKAPLITIKGFLGFLEKDAAAGNVARLKSDITRISDAATKMERLLSELLELSRIGRLMNPPQRVAVESLAREAVELVTGRLTARGVQVNIAPNLGEVWGDRARLVEVLQNLIDNAAKFMGDQPQPQIEIGARSAPEGRIFIVKDNGLGIEPEQRERVFGLFDKLDPHSEGTGIGLALVKRIIEVHGGRIWVESDGLGHGSTFCFTLAEQ